MKKIEMTVTPEIKGAHYIVEQGIPVEPMKPEDVQALRLLDAKGNPVEANIEHDGQDENGNTVWVRVTTTLTGSGKTEKFTLAPEPKKKDPTRALKKKVSEDKIHIENEYYSLDLSSPGNMTLSTSKGTIIDGGVEFQLWSDAASIVGGGAGTCRLAWFEPQGWKVEEETDGRMLVVLNGRVRKFRTVKPPEHEWHDDAQFDCELELHCYSFSPVIRYKMRIENHTVYQASLERYTTLFPLAKGAEITGGEKSDDAKFLSCANVKTIGGEASFVCNFIESLGKGAGINGERRFDLQTLTHEEVEDYAAGEMFEPHKYLHALKDKGDGLDIVLGGVNPPFDGNMRAAHPEVHRLFYLGMGKTLEGAIVVGADEKAVEAQLSQVFFELDPNHYSNTCQLPECGDPVTFGKYEEEVMRAANWLVETQWKGTLWSGEWWREYDVMRKQGVESTANGNGPLGPLYHYWRTGDTRMIECTRRALHFEYDVHLSKRREGLGSFYQCRRYLIDKMEWIHMRYQRIEGSIKAAHFFGDRRIREKTLEAMKKYARNLVCPNGAPGWAEGGIRGRRTPCGSDCTNFGEALAIIYRETGEEEFLELAKKMVRWTIRFMDTWDWDSYVGNSYGWHFLMRGALQTIKITGNKRMRDWYLDMAEKNMTYPVEDIEFVMWMDWLIVEAQKMGGPEWFLDVLKERTEPQLAKQMPNGNCTQRRECWPSMYPTYWDYGYNPKIVACYVPVLAARRKALGMKD